MCGREKNGKETKQSKFWKNDLKNNKLKTFQNNNSCFDPFELRGTHDDTPKFRVFGVYHLNHFGIPPRNNWKLKMPRNVWISYVSGVSPSSPVIYSTGKFLKYANFQNSLKVGIVTGSKHQRNYRRWSILWIAMNFWRKICVLWTHFLIEHQNNNQKALKSSRSNQTNLFSKTALMENRTPAHNHSQSGIQPAFPSQSHTKMLSEFFQLWHISIGFIGCFANLLLCYAALYRTPKATSSYATFILNFAITDFAECFLDLFLQPRHENKLVI